MKNKQLLEIIDLSSDTLASVAGAVVGTAIAGPAGTFGGAAIGPIIAATFKKVGKGIAECFLSENEALRIGLTYKNASDKIQDELQNGKIPRNDDFFEEVEGNRSKATVLLEGTLLKSRDEYEEKKLIYYSNFLANINFDKSISFDRANTLLRLIEQLSYRQLLILSYLEIKSVIDMKKWTIAFKDNQSLGDYLDFYSELMSLYNYQLLQQAGNGISMTVGNLQLSALGKTLCRLMELDSMPDKERYSIEDIINLIQAAKV